MSKKGSYIGGHTVIKTRTKPGPSKKRGFKLERVSRISDPTFKNEKKNEPDN